MMALAIEKCAPLFCELVLELALVFLAWDLKNLKSGAGLPGVIHNTSGQGPWYSQHPDDRLAGFPASSSWTTEGIRACSS